MISFTRVGLRATLYHLQTLGQISTRLRREEQRSPHRLLFLHTHLHKAIEEFLRNSSTLLNPRLLLAPAEELRRLHDPDCRVHEVRQGLAQEVRPGAKVRVEDEDHVTRRTGKGVSKVSSFLEFGAIRSSHVWKQEGSAKRAGADVSETRATRDALGCLAMCCDTRSGNATQRRRVEAIDCHDNLTRHSLRTRCSHGA